MKQGRLLHRKQVITDAVKVPYILECEVENAMQQMKNNKAPSDDQIVIEMTKGEGKTAVRKIAELFNQAMNKDKALAQYQRNERMLSLYCFSKKKKEELEDYRPISVFSHKLFMKGMKNKITLDEVSVTKQEQAAYRGGYSIHH